MFDFIRRLLLSRIWPWFLEVIWPLIQEALIRLVQESLEKLLARVLEALDEYLSRERSSGEDAVERAQSYAESAETPDEAQRWSEEAARLRKDLAKMTEEQERLKSHLVGILAEEQERAKSAVTELQPSLEERGDDLLMTSGGTAHVLSPPGEEFSVDEPSHPDQWKAVTAGTTEPALTGAELEALRHTLLDTGEGIPRETQKKLLETAIWWQMAKSEEGSDEVE